MAPERKDRPDRIPAQAPPAEHPAARRGDEPSRPLAGGAAPGVGDVGEPAEDTGGDMAEASARQELIGPSGGPPSDEERQWRGATPPEDVMARALDEPEEHLPEPGPPRREP